MTGQKHIYIKKRIIIAIITKKDINYIKGGKCNYTEFC
jgi:hypothetical protein